MNRVSVKEIGFRIRNPPYKNKGSSIRIQLIRPRDSFATPYGRNLETKFFIHRGPYVPNRVEKGSGRIQRSNIKVGLVHVLKIRNRKDFIILSAFTGCRQTIICPQ